MAKSTRVFNKVTGKLQKRAPKPTVSMVDIIQRSLGLGSSGKGKGQLAKNRKNVVDDNVNKQ